MLSVIKKFGFLSGGLGLLMEVAVAYQGDAKPRPTPCRVILSKAFGSSGHPSGRESISSSELQDLVLKYQAGDRSALDPILLGLRPIVINIAMNVSRPGNLSVEDLTQEGMLVVPSLLATYDPRRSLFLTFARQRIHFAIRGIIRDHLGITKHGYRYVRIYEKVVEELTHTLGRTPLEDEVKSAWEAEVVKKFPGQITPAFEDVQRWWHFLVPLRGDIPVGKSGPTRFTNIRSPDDPEKAAIKNEFWGLARKVLASNPLHYLVVKLHTEGWSPTEIVEILKSPERAEPLFDQYNFKRVNTSGMNVNHVNYLLRTAKNRLRIDAFFSFLGGN